MPVLAGRSSSRSFRSIIRGTSCTHPGRPDRRQVLSTGGGPYDGSPFFPDGNMLFRMAEGERITIFGTSAKYLSAVEKAGLEPGRRHDLGSLRTILSPGSPLLGGSFD